MNPRSFLRFPGILGTVCFLYYLWWNARWLSQGEIPPSILLTHTGIPAPTTGMTRSVIAASQGRLTEAFLWNPFTLPLICLFGGSFVFLAYRAIKKQKLTLPPRLAFTWLITLAASFLTKLALGSQWW